MRNAREQEVHQMGTKLGYRDNTLRQTAAGIDAFRGKIILLPKINAIKRDEGNSKVRRERRRR